MDRAGRPAPCSRGASCSWRGGVRPRPGSCCRATCTRWRPHGPARARGGAGRPLVDPGGEHAHARPPPVPGARRPAHAPGALRPARGAEAGLRGRRQQRGPLAVVLGAGRRGGGRGVARPSCRCRTARRSRPTEAVRDAHAVYTDVWISMGDDEAAEREAGAAAPYRLDEALLAQAREDAVALHCLPAHPGEEITEELLYGERSAVWDQAENRLHAQKALLELLCRRGALRQSPQYALNPTASRRAHAAGPRRRPHEDLAGMLCTCLALGLVATGCGGDDNDSDARSRRHDDREQPRRHRRRIRERRRHRGRQERVREHEGHRLQAGPRHACPRAAR